MYLKVAPKFAQHKYLASRWIGKWLVTFNWLVLKLVGM